MPATNGYTLEEISEYLHAQLLSGDPERAIFGVRSIQDAGERDVCYYGNTKYASYLMQTAAGALITSEPVETSASAVLLVDDAYDAFRKVLTLFKPDRTSGFTGVHPSAVIHPSATIGKSSRIGPLAVVERDCVIGENCTIGSGSILGPDVVVGDDCTIYPGVTLLSATTVGNGTVIHSGTVVGSDGFGFVPASDGRHRKIPQNGNVVIGSHVEIGANCTIDRAVTGSTSIGDFSKLDNLIQIAHNVTIGFGCIIAAQTGIAGSTRVGNGVVFGGQAGVGGHLVIGDGAVVAAQSGVTKNIKPGSTVSGNPARPHAQNLRLTAAVGRLPGVLELVKQMKTGAKEDGD